MRITLKSIKRFIKNISPSLVPFLRSVVNFATVYVVWPVRKLLHLPDKKVRKLIRFEIHLAEHCNLNCVGCSHFSPLAKASFVNIDSFRRDFERMGELFSHKCEWIHLMGGEPLLNPDIVELIKIARKNFTEGDIQIVTNGILLTQQTEEFWRTCHDENIQIQITPYPIKLDIDKIKDLAEKFGVFLQYFAQDGTKTWFYKESLDLSGKGNAAKNFVKCWLGNICIFLSNGKLFTCTKIPNVHIFNEAFHKNVPVTPDDYIDIYSDITGEEILKRLASHIPACSYCDIDNTKPFVQWRVSKKEISEWA